MSLGIHVVCVAFLILLRYLRRNIFVILKQVIRIHRKNIYIHYSQTSKSQRYGVKVLNKHHSLFTCICVLNTFAVVDIVNIYSIVFSSPQIFNLDKPEDKFTIFDHSHEIAQISRAHATMRIRASSPELSLFVNIVMKGLHVCKHTSQIPQICKTINE